MAIKKDKEVYVSFKESKIIEKKSKPDVRQVVRQFSDKDLDAVRMLFSQSMLAATEESFHNGKPIPAVTKFVKRQLDGDLSSVTSILSRFISAKGSNFWVAVENSSVVGCCAIKRLSESNDENGNTYALAELKHLCVALKSRRRGIGTLLKKLSSFAEKIRKLSSIH